MTILDISSTLYYISLTQTSHTYRNYFLSWWEMFKSLWRTSQRKFLTARKWIIIREKINKYNFYIRFKEPFIQSAKTWQKWFIGTANFKSKKIVFQSFSILLHSHQYIPHSIYWTLKTNITTIDDISSSLKNILLDTEADKMMRKLLQICKHLNENSVDFTFTALKWFHWNWWIE